MTQNGTNVQHIELFNREIISKHIKFPLEFDGFGYVNDMIGNMIAQKCFNISRETMQDFTNMVNDVYYDTNLENFDSMIETSLCTLEIGDMNIFVNGNKVISVRGWGRLQYFPNGEEIYTEIGKFLKFCRNYGKLQVDLLK